MSQVLILKEKHGERYYSATTDEELALACLTILKERRKDGYWYYKPELQKRHIDANVQTYLDLSEEEVQALPEKIRERAEAERTKHKRIIARFEQEHAYESEWYDEMVRITDLPVEEAVKEVKTFRTSSRTEPMAYFILRGRSDYEYEGMELETMIVADGK